MNKRSEARKARSKEEKAAEKEKNDAAKALYVVCARSARCASGHTRVAVLLRSHMYAFVDGHVEKLGNCVVEPPNLFRGRGEHPRTGTYKRRVMPESVRAPDLALGSHSRSHG